MEWVIVAVIVAAALICPALMFGPALLQRLGLRKGSAGPMSCMGMSEDDAPRGESIEAMRRRRAELDREIAAMETAADRASRRSRALQDPPAGAP